MTAGDRSGFDWIGYGEFGTRFIRRAVTIERVTEALAAFAGKGMRIGPIAVGPIGFVELDARGEIGTPTVRHRDGDLVSFDVSVPASLDLRMKIGQVTSARAEVVVDLVLTVRAADPLLLVIDIPPVQADHVELKMSADGFAAAALPFVEPLEGEIRRQVARQVTGILSDPGMRASRVIDIGAKIDDVPPFVPQQLSWLGYAAFGERFFRVAVSEKRLGEGLAELAGREITIGPLQAGPKDRATVTAHGVVGSPSLLRQEANPVTFDVEIPVRLDLTITLSRDVRYACDIVVNLELVAMAADDLVIVIDIPRITADDVDLTLTAQGVFGKVLRAVGGLDAEIREQVAAKVNEETADPAAGGRVVDVGARVDAA